MPTITIQVTDTQLKGLEYIASSPQEWVDNLVTNRARIANDEVIQRVMNHCLDNGIAVPATREEIVAYGFDNEIVKTAAQRNVEALQEGPGA